MNSIFAVEKGEQRMSISITDVQVQSGYTDIGNRNVARNIFSDPHF